MKQFVYFLRPVGSDGPVKIGHSNNPNGRLATYMPWSPCPLEIAATIPGGTDLERRFHFLFGPFRSHHEWFFGAPPVVRALQLIVAGRFDPERLPKAGLIPHSAVDAREWVRDRERFSSLLLAFKAAGIAVPKDICSALWDRDWEAPFPPRSWTMVRAWVADQPCPVLAAVEACARPLAEAA